MGDGRWPSGEWRMAKAARQEPRPPGCDRCCTHSTVPPYIQVSCARGGRGRQRGGEGARKGRVEMIRFLADAQRQSCRISAVGVIRDG